MTTSNEVKPVSRYDQRIAESEAHIKNPEVGDWWNEMFCNYLTVVYVLPDDDGIIALCKTEDYQDGYRYIMEEAEYMTLTDFKKKVKYALCSVKARVGCANEWLEFITEQGLSIPVAVEMLKKRKEIPKINAKITSPLSPEEMRQIIEALQLASDYQCTLYALDRYRAAIKLLEPRL